MSVDGRDSTSSAGSTGSAGEVNGRAGATGPRLNTRFGDAEESPGLLLWQVTNRWQAAMRAVLKPFGLTHVQFVLLAALSWLGADGPVTQKALADHAATDPMMTSQVLRALEAQGLVERRPHPQDGRARALAVTAEGRELADRAVVAVEACDAEFFAPLADSADGFTRALRQLKA
ncbi:MAG TPA: MarR family transcriptional regulator [Actinocrinis sp.]|nr:MarR family transcriptional regulator [Actinocrinis sp.]